MEYYDKYKSKTRKANFSLPDHFIADGSVLLDTDDYNDPCLYLLDINDPAIGMFKEVGCINYHLVNFVPKENRNTKSYKKKLKKMERLLDEAEAAFVAGKLLPYSATAKPDNKSSEDVAAISDDEATIARFAAMMPLEFSRVAKDEALALGVSVGDLKKAVIAEQKRACSSLVLGPQLVRDIYDIFENKNTDRVGTGETFILLHRDTERIWNRLFREGKFSARKMSSILSDYGISSVDMRIKGSKPIKCYEKTQFKEALKLI